MVALASALALAGCASAPKSRPSPAAQRDEVLGLVGPETPQTLQRVTRAPYAAPEPRNCEEVARQLAELDAMLGPDVDALNGGGEDMVVEWAKGAMRGLVPYRGVVRFLTGASKKERALAAAVLAAAARRGYLKGVRESLGCPAPGGAAAYAAQ